MKEFKVGGKITLEDDTSYRILDIIKYNDEKYLFCCSETKPIKPKVLGYEEKDGDVRIFRNKEVSVLTLITCTKDDNTKQTVYIAELMNVE